MYCGGHEVTLVEQSGFPSPSAGRLRVFSFGLSPTYNARVATRQISSKGSSARCARRRARSAERGREGARAHLEIAFDGPESVEHQFGQHCVLQDLTHALPRASSTAGQARRDARGGGRDQPSAGEAARTTRSPLTVSRSKESEGDYRVGDPADASAREVIERGGALRLPGRTEVHLSISVGRHGYLLTGTDGAITIAYVVVYFALHLLYTRIY